MSPVITITISLKDFSLPEVRDVVREGLNLAGGHLTGDINEVAGALKSLAGGVPTLTLGLLRHAYEHMAKRVKSVDGEMASLTADDVHNAYCVRPNEVERRLALFSELTLTGDDIRLEKVRELVGALANDRFGAGPWAIEPLKTRMEAEIGTTILRSQAIDPLLDALPRYGFVENEDAKRIIAFRGNILRQRLAVDTIAYEHPLKSTATFHEVIITPLLAAVSKAERMFNANASRTGISWVNR